MSNPITPEVLTALVNGDHQAFETIFIAYFNKVKVFVAQLIKSDEDAEELAQEIFFRLWVHRSSLNTSRPFHTLIYTVARNAAFNYIKHQAVEQQYSLHYIPLDENETPEEVLYAKELALLIEMATSKMPAQRQKIFRMHRQEGLNSDEIAEKLQIARKTVDNQLSLAIKDMRKMLAHFVPGS
ncbi:MAG: RNA polymerase sigma-70 factor [Tannerellaceae bacterium]|nr:RNA polymerase sigma-70 factor [Tannerellaceae bacterium]